MKTDNPLKILIVEDEVLIGKLIEQDLVDAGHQVLDIAFGSEEALDMIYKYQPELVLLDINIDGTKDGIDVAMIIKEKYDIPYIFITAHSDRETLQRAKKAKPCAYLVKPYRAQDLFTSIEIGLYNFESRKKENRLNLERLNTISLSPISEREFDIVLDISQGLTNAQIAENQYLSLNTIKWHLQNIYSKLGVKNRTSVAKLILDLEN